MADQGAECLVDQLAAGLLPVRRLRSPVVRAMEWLALVVVAAALLGAVADRDGVAAQFAAQPDLPLAAAMAALTAVLSALAAFQLSLPDRAGTWALLPLPAAAMWLSVSGWGCLRAAAPGLAAIEMEETAHCLAFIIGVSAPLSAVLLVLLGRACPLRPGLVAMLGGLAAAAASAVLLSLFHPFDASWADLAAHILAVGIVVFATKVLAPRVFP